MVTMSRKRFSQITANEKLSFELTCEGTSFGVCTYKVLDGTEDKEIHLRSDTIDHTTGMVDVYPLTDLGALALELYANDVPVVRRKGSNLACD